MIWKTYQNHPLVFHFELNGVANLSVCFAMRAYRVYIYHKICRKIKYILDEIFLIVTIGFIVICVNHLLIFPI